MVSRGYKAEQPKSPHSRNVTSCTHQNFGVGVALPGRRRICGPSSSLDNLRLERPDTNGSEGRAVYTASHGARLSSVPSGDRSANPASVPGCSGLQPALLSVSSAQKCSGAGRLASPSGVSRAARSAVSCQSPASGHRASRSEYTRGQSRETGSLTRLFGSVETTAKFVSMGHAQCRTRLSWRSAAAFQWSHSHAGGSRAGSGNGTRSEAIKVVPPLDKQSGFYSRTSLLMGRMGVASYFRSKLTEPLSSGCSFRAGRVSDQIRGLVVTSDLEDTYFPSPSFPITGSS